MRQRKLSNRGMLEGFAGTGSGEEGLIHGEEDQ
jgi:hypothetical protein